MLVIGSGSHNNLAMEAIMIHRYEVALGNVLAQNLGWANPKSLIFPFCYIAFPAPEIKADILIQLLKFPFVTHENKTYSHLENRI